MLELSDNPKESVAITCRVRVAAVAVSDTWTTPTESMVIPGTDGESEKVKAPVPPEAVKAEETAAREYVVVSD